MQHRSDRPRSVRTNRKRGERFRNTAELPLVNIHTLKIDFVGTKSTATRHEAVRQMEAFKDPAYAVAAGEMCLELAHAKNQSPDRAASWLERARTNWERTIEISKELTNHMGRAAAQLALYETHFSHAVKKEIPPVEVTKANYEQVLRVLYAQAEELQTSPERNDRMKDIAGELGEWSVGLLAMRFGIHEGDPTWMAVPSHLSQDMGRKTSGNDIKNSWDVSIFTQYDGDTPPELTYKVQTKTRFDPREPTYADDIAVVHISDDLDICRGRMRKGISASRISLECHAEAFSDDPSLVSISGSALDRRQDLLLGLLG